MMNKVILTMLVGLSIPVNAAEIGLGISLDSKNKAIYIPININKNIRIEPFASYKKTNTSDLPYRQGPKTTDVKKEYGIGVFKTHKPYGKSQFYYGARLSSVTIKEGRYDNRNTTGYRVSPTVGFEYAVVDNITIGAEVDFSLLKTNPDYTTKKEYNTNTRLMLRYTFR